MSSRPLKTIASIVAFIAGMALGSAVISAFTPFPKVGNLWQKYHHFRAKKDDYSLLYIGSSRVFHEFIPEQFDTELAGRGQKVKSLNFGQDGMWPPESFYMLRQVLAMKPKALRWVFIDLMAIKPLLEGNENSQRSIYWHDLRHTWISLRNIASVASEGQHTLGEKSARALQHADLFWQRFTQAGEGSELLQIELKLQRDKKPEPLEKAGFEVGGSGPLAGEELERFNTELARLRSASPKPISPVLRDALADITAEVRAAGAQPVFVVPSSLYGLERFTDWPPPDVTVFAFDDPEKYPGLYNPAHRFDRNHLDAVGAQEFTRLLAERFAKFLEAQKP